MKKILSLLFLLSSLVAQTTGKISGVVVDKDKNDALPGANIYIINSAYGTASDGEGRFTIINIPPGKYTLKVDMIGYKSIQLDDLIVSVNRTTSLDIEMEATVIEGEVVTVEVLSDLHRISVDNFGEMEAFLTDGLRSLLNTGYAQNMREYTVRWPGHIQKWSQEKDHLSDSQLIEAWKFDETRHEFTWMEICLSYTDYQVTWEIVDTGKDGHSSMARTTGLVTTACAVELINQSNSESSQIECGVFAPEDLELDSIEKVIQYLKNEDVTILRTIIE